MIAQCSRPWQQDVPDVSREAVRVLVLASRGISWETVLVLVRVFVVLRGPTSLVVYPVLWNALP